MKNFRLKKIISIGFLSLILLFAVFCSAASFADAQAANNSTNSSTNSTVSDANGHFQLMSATSVEPLYKTLADQNDGNTKMVTKVAKALVDMVNGFVIVVLLLVAFSQILRLNINTYGVKKMLPAIVMAVIGANFAFLFCRIMVDFANMVIAGITSSGGGISLTSQFSNPCWADPSGSCNPPNTMFNLKESGGDVFWFLLMQFVAIALAIIIAILSFLFYIRIWVVYFLVALSPAAFMTTILPQTKSLFNQWWSNLSKWVFMPVTSVFWLWLGSQWVKNASLGSNWLMNLVFTGACFYFAITTPFKMGGAIMGQWKNLGQKAGKWGLNKSGISGAYNYMKEKNKLNSESRKQGIYNAIKASTGLGTGLDAAKARSARVKGRQSAISKRGESAANSNYWAQKSLQRTANIESEAKEKLSAGKANFASKDKHLIEEQTRSETRAGTYDKDAEALIAEIKRKYFSQADPGGEDGHNQQKKDEILAFLNASANSTVAQDAVAKVEKTLTGKMFTDRIAYDNIQKEIAKQNEIITRSSSTAAQISTAQAELTKLQTKKAQMDAHIDSGASWATKNHEMRAAERSRTLAKVDAYVKDEAEVALNKTADAIEAELTDFTKHPEYQKMWGKKPEEIAKTSDKVDFLTHMVAADKIMQKKASRGLADAEALSMASVVLEQTHTNDTANSADIASKIAASYNKNNPGRPISAAEAANLSTLNNLLKTSRFKDNKEGAQLISAIRTHMTNDKRYSEQV